MADSNTLLASIKFILMSTGVVFIATLITPSWFFNFNLASSSTTFSAPSSSDDLLQLPDASGIWSFISSLLRPPYLYLIVNGIIITIAASSRLYHSNHHAAAADIVEPSYFAHSEKFIISSSTTASAYSIPPESARSGSMDAAPYGSVSDNETREAAVNSVSARGLVVGSTSMQKVMEEVQQTGMVQPDNLASCRSGGASEEQNASSALINGKSTWAPSVAPLMRQDSVKMLSTERLPASARFGHPRRHSRVNTEGRSINNNNNNGKALRVAKSKRSETLEHTWKAITEGRHMPLTRHLKKSETWEDHSRQPDHVLEGAKKSETLVRDKMKMNHSSSAPPISACSKLKKEPSLGQDELNRRVEAFINKFNEDMRLQRQQSMQQFMEMINRAAY